MQPARFQPEKLTQALATDHISNRKQLSAHEIQRLRARFLKQQTVHVINTVQSAKHPVAYLKSKILPSSRGVKHHARRPQLALHSSTTKKSTRKIARVQHKNRIKSRPLMASHLSQGKKNPLAFVQGKKKIHMASTHKNGKKKVRLAKKNTKHQNGA